MWHTICGIQEQQC